MRERSFFRVTTDTRGFLCVATRANLFSLPTRVRRFMTCRQITASRSVTERLLLKSTLRDAAVFIGGISLHFGYLNREIISEKRNKHA